MHHAVISQYHPDPTQKRKKKDQNQPMKKERSDQTQNKHRRKIRSSQKWGGEAREDTNENAGPAAMPASKPAQEDTNESERRNRGPSVSPAPDEPINVVISPGLAKPETPLRSSRGAPGSLSETARQIHQGVRPRPKIRRWLNRPTSQT